jgi:hypothetical protein
VGELAVAGAVLLVVVAVLVVVGVRQRAVVPDADEKTPWRVCTEASGGVTVVCLRHGRQTITVAEVADDSPSWQDDMMVAQAEAERRLATLNVEGS